MKKTFGTPYYIAPEVLKGSYNSMCDMWSCGVILFILLSGRPPFEGSNDDEILRAVSLANYDMTHPIWNSISPSGKDVVKKLLTVNAENRITA